MPGKGVELPLPEASVAGDPQGGVLHGSGNQTAAAEPAVLRSGEQSRVLQHAQVFRNRGERYVEGLGQLGDRRLSPRQAREDRPAGWVRQRGKCRVEAAVRIVNHMVKYSRVIASCQARNARRLEAECQPGLWIAAGGESPWGLCRRGCRLTRVDAVAMVRARGDSRSGQGWAGAPRIARGRGPGAGVRLARPLHGTTSEWRTPGTGGTTDGGDPGRSLRPFAHACTPSGR